MRKTLNKRTLPILIFAMLFVLSFAIFFAIPSTRAFADDFQFMSGEGYKTSYGIGEEVDIVKGKMTHGENVYENISGVVTTPSGKSVRVDSIVLSEEGIYTVEYSTVVNGTLGKKNLYHKVNFSATKSIFSFDSSVSSFKYGVDETEYGLKGKASEDYKGLTVNINSGDTFYFNRPIDFNNLTKSDRFIQFGILPTIRGSADVLSIDIKLTDCYDPTNYIYFTFLSGYKRFGRTYIGTTYNTTGNSANDFTAVISLGSAGSWENYNFAGDDTAKYKHNQVYLGVTYDISGNEFYSSITNQNNGAPRLCMDFDDLSIWTYLWKGFTTGEAFLSITPNDWMGSTCSLFITELAGLETLEPELSEDAEPPVLSLDYGKFSENNIPNAFVGCKYPIFSASAFDIYSDPTIEFRVYKDYFSDDLRSSVNFDETGFIPTTPGLYSIVYTATDKVGNSSEKVVSIQCLEEQTLNVTLNGDGRRECSVGETIKVDTYSLKGVSGESFVRVTATKGSEVIVITNGQFVPTSAGEYTVTYEFTDFSNQSKAVSYKVVASVFNGPVLTPAINFSNYYVVGFKHILPEVTAFDYSTNQPCDVTIWVEEDGVSREVTDGYVPRLTSNGVAYVYYKSGDVVSEKYPVSVKSVNKVSSDEELDFSKFFLVNNATAIAQPKYTSIISNNNVKSISGEFVRPILMRDFKLMFSFLAANSGAEKITFTLRDIHDSSIEISFSFINTEDGVVFGYGDNVTALEYRNDFETSESTPYDISYDNLNCYFTDFAKVRHYYTVDNNGKEFTGFPSQYAYLTFEVEGITSQNLVFNIFSINGQVFNNNGYDESNPYIFTGNYNNRAKINEIISIPDIIAYDVLDEYVEVKITVRDSDRNVILDTDGNRLLNRPYSDDIKIKLTKYADYKITISAEDGSRNQRSKVITISVKDNVAPVITLKGEPSVNSRGEIRIPNFTATDNIDGEIKNTEDATKLYVYLEDPTGWIDNVNPSNIKQTIEPGKSIKVTMSGTYRLFFVALDNAGNLGFAIRTLTVKLGA